MRNPAFFLGGWAIWQIVHHDQVSVVIKHDLTEGLSLRGTLKFIRRPPQYDQSFTPTRLLKCKQFHQGYVNIET